MHNLKVTVLMPVYNEEEYVSEAVDSILNQTFEDFEFLIINDGSTDRTSEILDSYKDSRIKIINNKENIGITRSLNKGLKLAKGKYIARMDADDISMPKRLEKQVGFLNKNTNVVVCGTWVKTFGNKVCEWRYPSNSKVIQCQLLFNCNVMAHPTVVIKNNFLKEHDLKYNAELEYAQDWDLWQKISMYSQVANLSEFLLNYRLTDHNEKKRQSPQYKRSINTIIKRGLKRLKITPSSKEIEIHKSLSRNFQSRVFEHAEVKTWLLKLLEANQIHKRYPSLFFRKTLLKKYYTFMKSHNNSFLSAASVCSSNLFKKIILN